MNRVRKGGLFSVGLFSLVLAAGTARAQEGQPKDGPALEGPKVRDNSMPGKKQAFGDGNKDRKAGDAPIRLPVVMKALDVLRGEKAGENKLTDAQESSIKGAFDEFQKSTREFMDKHREELGTLRSQLSPEDRAKVDQAFGGEGRGPRPGKAGDKGGGNGGDKKDQPKPDGDPMMTPGEDAPKVDAETSAKARARLTEIYAGRPKPEDAQAKAWSTLTEPQRTILQAEIKRVNEEMAKKGKPGAGGGGLEDLKGKSPEEIMNDPRVPERLRERLKAMTPEERKEAVKKFLDRERGGPKRGGDGGEGKPAPKPSDVNVPAPR